MSIDYYGDGSPEMAVAPDALSNMSANELLTLIVQIPEGYKTVFNLSIIEGYPHKEIAKLLGIEESSSRSQLTKARKYIQRSLAATLNVEL
jgi:RNA polymerase sigma-70 factor (ECF subfamily)